MIVKSYKDLVLSRSFNDELCYFYANSSKRDNCGPLYNNDVELVEFLYDNGLELGQISKLIFWAHVGDVEYINAMLDKFSYIGDNSYNEVGV